MSHMSLTLTIGKIGSYQELQAARDALQRLADDNAWAVRFEAPAFSLRASTPEEIERDAEARAQERRTHD